MAYRRSIAARSKFFYQQQQRISPSISHIHRGDNESEELHAKPISRYPEAQNYFQHRSFVAGNNFSNYRRQNIMLHDMRFAVPAGCGMAYSRNYSSAGTEEGATDKIEVLDNVVGMLRDTAPAVNEVAVAAADSFAPVAAIQYIIDYVHCFTGFNWWASIVVTTLLFRCLQLPLSISHLKSFSKFALLKPHWIAVFEELQKKGMRHQTVDEAMRKIIVLFKEYDVTLFYPLKGPLLTAPIFCAFFFAISNMAAKVPSFKDGGILWFTDLSTPDSLYVFPVLTALALWIMVECNAAQEGMEGDPPHPMIKNFMRAAAALAILFTAHFPTILEAFIPLAAIYSKVWGALSASAELYPALFCYWTTSGLFSLAYGFVIQKPEVKKYLGIPIVPVTPPSTNESPSFQEAIKNIAESAKKFGESIDQIKKYAWPSYAEASKPMNQVIAESIAQIQKSASSSAEASSKPTSQSIASSSGKSLEKKVEEQKRSKKGKRRIP